jgi:UDP-N-acetylmuramoyl-tripeptide--D-alanyl-D-alanine ligase
MNTSINELPKNFSLEPGRSSLLPGNKETIILDSSYNANPFAAKELFLLLKELAKPERRNRIIVLGDLRELGNTAPSVYADIVKEAAKVADTLILTNDSMREYGIPAAEQAGMILNENLYWFTNGKQLSFHINEMVDPKAVVLFEGSQNTVYLEYAVKELCANKDPGYLNTHIPRMSGDWLEVK